MPIDVAPKNFPAFGRRGQHSLRQFLQHAPLESHQTAIVDRTLLSQACHLHSKTIRRRKGSCAGRSLKLGHGAGIDVKLVPEKPADRRIGAWIERFVQVAGQQRKGTDGAAAQLSRPSEQLLEITEISPALPSFASCEEPRAAETAPTGVRQNNRRSGPRLARISRTLRELAPRSQAAAGDSRWVFRPGAARPSIDNSGRSRVRLAACGVGPTCPSNAVLRRLPIAAHSRPCRRRGFPVYATCTRGDAPAKERQPAQAPATKALLVVQLGPPERP